MADSRYRYPTDGYVEAPREKPESGTGRAARAEDPLAELARLIGQEDPFKDFYRDEPLVRSQPTEPEPYREAPRARRTEDSRFANPAPATPREEPAPRAADPYARSARQAPAEPAYRDEPAPRAAADPYARQARQTPAEPAYRDEQATRARRGEEGRYSNTGAAFAAEPASPQSARSSAETYSRVAPSPARSEPASAVAAEPRRRTEAAQQAYPSGYGQGAYERDFGHEDQAFDPYYGEQEHGDDAYDEPVPRRRSRLMLLVAGTAIGLAALGIGGVFAYRALLGGGTPPTIRADSGPNKVAPTGQTDSGNQKLIYDRVGAPGKGTERVVSREEQPVDPARATPRVVLPGAPVAEEPRKVRTITVRADGSMVTPPPAAAPPPVPAAPRTVAMPVPQPAAPPPQVAPAAPAPQAIAPRPVQPAPTVATQPVAPRPATQPQPSMRVASTPPAAEPDASGPGYVVQISAGRSDADARSALRTAQSRYADVLGGQPTTVQRVELERGTFYRAQFGPFASREAANDLCSKLRSAGGTCVVQQRN